MASPVPDEKADAGGRITLRVQFDTEDHARFIVLGLGPRVDVVEPEVLRARVLAEAAAVLDRARRD